MLVSKLAKYAVKSPFRVEHKYLGLQPKRTPRKK
jgi:hypothetical protein